MAAPSVRTMPIVKAIMQRPAGTFLVELPGGRVVACVNEEAVRRLVNREAPGSAVLWS